MERTDRRGQPIITLGLLMASWVGARMMLLAAADASSGPLLAQNLEPDRAVAVDRLFSAVQTGASGLARTDGRDRPAEPRTSLSPGSGPQSAPDPVPAGADGGARVMPLIEAPRPRLDPIPEPQPSPLAEAGAPPREPFRANPRLAGGHMLLWLAALSQVPLPPEAVPGRTSPADPGLKSAPDKSAPDKSAPGRSVPDWAGAGRWSADGWLLLRRGGTGGTALGVLPSSYGASQAGAVIRFALAPASQSSPKAFLRVSRAVHGPHDPELAAGLALRPIRGLPVTAQAELRVTQLASGTALRPAALLVSEFPPLPLPGGFTAESYGAAGYVGGRFATGFAEGQVRIERPIAALGPARLRAGGGVWGGVQKGAGRLDAGPSATLGFPLGTGGGRLSADWRFRLAGNSAPQSGPAITISAGF